ncbi:MAG: hypothetical protein CFH42_00660 [Alphaproteobacteria bacterium MarineAlpha12_Bin1]|nr:MAG: hypothetical protein CFH42_00660 [Alphaproteobacteria bacterium MarineAlpha12_Bin1]
MRIENLRQEFDISIKLIHFPLHPDTPAKGMSMSDLFSGRDYDPEEAHQRMKGLMEVEGLPYGERTHTYNSRLAQELGSWAETQPEGHVIHDKLYRAYFVDGKNIGDVEVLVGLAEKIGLNSEETKEVLYKRSFKESVDQDWEKSREYGVTGVPTFVSNGYGVVGAQPYEALVQLVIQAGASRRASD